ncbi:SMP-30/gluconolactonase/LRE family protein [Achromobacter xylosoxidans]
MNPDIQCVVQSADILGEVPLWCDRSQRLWWVDVRRPALQSYDPATDCHTAQRLPETLLVGAIALREAGGFVLATNHGLYFYDPASGLPPQAVVDPESDKPGHRLNDGKCDRRGASGSAACSTRSASPPARCTASTRTIAAMPCSTASCCPMRCPGAPTTAACISPTRTTR